MRHAEIAIAGAGIVGLSVALELHRLGVGCVVVEAGEALSESSSAAAGMLAVQDPANPVELRPLADLAASLYPEYLDRIAELSGARVAFQTAATLQAVGAAVPASANPHEIVPQLVPGEHRFYRLKEHSVDPRELGPALLAAVRKAGIEVREGAALARIQAGADQMRVETAGHEAFTARFLVDCMGAWSPAPVAPRKGQMLSVALPDSLPLETVVRTEDVYIVPRTHGPNAGKALIGATVEDAGFDKTVRPRDILALHARAAALLPQLKDAWFHESWAGLRPATLDGLPLLGPSPRQPRYVIANGHFRNGILLAPATARVVGQCLTGQTPAIDLQPFRPGRF